jgi:hypothetical protein
MFFLKMVLTLKGVVYMNLLRTHQFWTMYKL